MKTRYVAWLAVLLLIGIRAEAQEVSGEEWRDNLEQLAMEGAEGDWEEELRELSRLQDRPLNLNIATRQQLEQFPFLTDKQIENLLAYIYIQGEMKTLYELQLVEEMDKQTIRQLLPFVYVGPVERKSSFPDMNRLLKTSRHEVLTRMDVPFYRRDGYRNAYLGPAVYHSLRYDGSFGSLLQVGFSAEKDAGEPLFALHNRQGYDYYGGYVCLKDFRWIRTWVLGNYRMNYGQGLVLGNGFGLGKSFSLATLDAPSGGIRPYGSTSEADYFQGTALSVGITKDITLDAFYSHRRLDGRVEGDTILSITETGLHRTEREAERKQAAALQLVGGHAGWQGRYLRLGVTGVYYFFDKIYAPEVRPYAKYRMRGQRFYNIGVDYRLAAGRFSWQGEAALGTRGYALLNRVGYEFSPQYRVVLLHRLYTHDYWARFAHAFSEGGAVENENGWYVAADLSPWDAWRFFLSADFFSFPWWRYRISRPSQGMEMRGQAVWSASGSFRLLAGYRYRRRERDVTGTRGGDIRLTHHHLTRLRATYRPSAWSWQLTADYNRFLQQGVSAADGWQWVGLCRYQPEQFPLFGAVQAAYFHTDSYDARVYAYEPGLLYTFSSPAFSGRGFRHSLLLGFRYRRVCTLRVKLSNTCYTDRTEIGRGDDRIGGRCKTDLQLQLRLVL